MADTVTSQTSFNGPYRLVMRFTNTSDGTGEAAVIKVDKSTFTGLNGLEPTKLAIERIRYSVAGMVVKILFDHTTDDQVAALQGDGELDFRSFGGVIDPASAGGTGDILFTTAAHSTGDSYDITLHMRKID